ncbi:MAG: hypothetical protein M3R13_04430 [Armatimonadota bacterium]|nr:hypothetical protein [Armatimonadota bacterium]
MKYAEITDRGDRFVLVMVDEKTVDDPRAAADLIGRLRNDQLNDVIDLAKVVLVHRNGHEIKQFPVHEVPDLSDGDQLDACEWFDIDCIP